MCRYEEWNRATHELGYCEAPVVSEGLCLEHLEWVADCKAQEVSKLDMKYPYRAPRRKSVKLAPSHVVETILPPDTAGMALRVTYKNATGKKKGEAFAALMDYTNKRALRINEWRKPVWTAEDQAEKERVKAAAHAKLMQEQAEFMDRRAKAEAKEVERRAAEWKAAQAKMAALEPDEKASEAIPDNRPIGKRSAPEPTAATVCGFRFEYRAVCGSGFYFNGKRVASTREGLERMGPAVLAKVCR